jgi:tetratricopeptide (TPR) repeat protein
MQAAPVPQRHPWLNRLKSDPAKAVDSLLQGSAHLPGLQRISPCEALMAIMGDIPREAEEWHLLDSELLAWLQRRRNRGGELIARPGGAERFIRETGEAFRCAWRLDLERSSSWIRGNLPDLLRWADNFTINATFDLGRAVLTAGARLQQGEELRFHWFRVCEEAAHNRLRHRLDNAMLGLSRLPVRSGGAGPSQDVVTGLARWASRLPNDRGHEAEVVREWRALKAAFPRMPTFWRGCWEAILEDGRYAHPFLEWLKNADPALAAPASANRPKRELRLPNNISGLLADWRKDVEKGGLTEPVWLKMKLLLDQLEHYADLTGDSYFLVTSCTNVASIVLPHAPGHALAQVRRALLWAPSHGHAWSVRARALEQLGSTDLAQAVLWEGLRRAPMSPALFNQLALLLIRAGREAEGEALLRQAVPDRADRVTLYTLAHLMIAQGRPDKGAGCLDLYRERIGRDKYSALIERLIAAGPAGQRNAQDHMHGETLEPAPVVAWDAEAEERVLAAERVDEPRLRRISAVADADMLFRMGGVYRAKAVERIDEVLSVDDTDAYAQVVKALAIPEHRTALEGRSGQFDGSLPVQLAILPEKVAPERWERLEERFPDGKPLIHLVRLARGDANASVKSQLSDWTNSPSRWDEGWAEFVKKRVAKRLEGDASVDIEDLAHDALTQAVDVGWSIRPAAA